MLSAGSTESFHLTLSEFSEILIKLEFRCTGDGLNAYTHIPTGWCTEDADGSSSDGYIALNALLGFLLTTTALGL